MFARHVSHQTRFCEHLTAMVQNTQAVVHCTTIVNSVVCLSFINCYIIYIKLHNHVETIHMRNTRVFCMNAGGRRDMLADVWCRKQPSLTFFFSPSPLTGDCAFESLKELQSSSKLEFHGITIINAMSRQVTLQAGHEWVLKALSHLGTCWRGMVLVADR